MHISTSKSSSEKLLNFQAYCRFCKEIVVLKIVKGIELTLFSQLWTPLEPGGIKINCILLEIKKNVYIECVENVFNMSLFSIVQHRIWYKNFPHLMYINIYFQNHLPY